MGNLLKKAFERMNASAEVVDEKSQLAHRVCDELVGAIAEMWGDEGKDNDEHINDVKRVGQLARELKFICDDVLATLRISEMDDARMLLDGRRVAREKFARERKIRQIAAEHDRRDRLAAAEAEKHCSVEGCRKPRAFFDEDGAGYCKRHANDRGIRPTGKVGS